MYFPKTVPSGAETLTVSNTAITPLALIQAVEPDWKPERCNSFKVYVRTNNMNWAGSYTPTTTEGEKITAGNVADFQFTPLDAIKLIRDASADATIHVEPYFYNIKN